MIEHIKKILPYVLAVMVGTWAGFYIGTQYYPRIETETVTVDKPIVVQGEAQTVTKTEIAYVPKETVVVKYIDSTTGQEVTSIQQEKADLDAQIGKTDFNVRLNGKDVQFTKTDDERFIFDKNKLALNQSNTVTFDAKVEPHIIDKTKHWEIGIGYGSNKWAGKVDFPIGNNNDIGGWVYGDKETQTAGVALRF